MPRGDPLKAKRVLDKLSVVQIQHCLRTSLHWCELLRKLGYKQANHSGIHNGLVKGIYNKCVKLNILDDFQKFERKAQIHKGEHSNRKSNPDAWKYRHPPRTYTEGILKRAGVVYECAICKCEHMKKYQDKWYWYDKEILLDIDHINGNCRDNSYTNLRYLCCNCHRSNGENSNVKHKRKSLTEAMRDEAKVWLQNKFVLSS